jgi:transcriptional regulator NrdR family protein
MSFSRLGEHGFRVRRRQCLACNAFFSTVELPEDIAERALNPQKVERRASLMLASKALLDLAHADAADPLGFFLNNPTVGVTPINMRRRP